MNAFLEQTEYFLSQSYKDSWEDFRYSLENLKAPAWDWVIITASHQKQAEAYQLQLQDRLTERALPPQTRFAVLPDPEGERIGSGGATLNAVKYINAHDERGFEALKVLLIHSGGDSKRIPQYSACGKLFASVQKQLPNRRCATLFDEILISMAGVPARAGAGMLLLSGDTLMLYNPLQLELKQADVLALSIKTNIEEGKEHGVFVSDRDGYVTEFLHKRSAQTLIDRGAVSSARSVDIDTGAYWLSSAVLRALLNMLDDPVNGGVRAFVADAVNLNFYTDVISAMARDNTLENYLREIPEKTMNNALLNCRKILWSVLRDFKVKIIRLNPARYIHFGTTRELFSICVSKLGSFQYLGWEKAAGCYNALSVTCSCYNSVIFDGARVSPFSYIENSYIGCNAVVGNNVVLSGVTLYDVSIPDDVVLHCLKQTDGRFVCRIYGIDDNPKSSPVEGFLGKSLECLLARCGLSARAVCPTAPATLWSAEIYPVCSTVSEAVHMALTIWNILHDAATEEERAAYVASPRVSLEQSFAYADTLAMLAWQKKIRSHACVEKCVRLLALKNDMTKALFHLERGKQLELEAEFLLRKINENDPFLTMRLYLLLSVLCKEEKCLIQGKSSEEYEDLCYEVIKKAVTRAAFEKYPLRRKEYRMRMDEVTEQLPARVNFCGSPSDAAPYCLEYGGTMLDGAIDLNGEVPIRAIVRKLKETKIVFANIDENQRKEFFDLADIADCGNPYDPFALHKAVLVATGIVPADPSGDSMEALVRDLGGGLCLETSVRIPKGSGLGTSSILAAACCRAVNRILGREDDLDRLYAQVFAVEQLMNTGGGWQDQVGGLTRGLKLERSAPGVLQNITVDHIALPDTIIRELQERFALIFSGQRRLARNVLRQEMNKCIMSDPAALSALERIQEICVLMKFELERGNITKFARYVTEQFKLVKTVDKGASNTCIEYIFDVCADLIDGKSVCGAGGGGFLQVILKKGVTREQLKQRIGRVFQDSGVEVWDCSLI